MQRVGFLRTVPEYGFKTNKITLKKKIICYVPSDLGEVSVGAGLLEAKSANLMC